MALSKEEIAIRVGVDSRGVAPGLAGARRQINKFADDSIKKLTSILKANVFLAAADLLRQLIPSSQEYWENFYGATEEQIRQSDEAHARVKALSKAVAESRMTVGEAVRKEHFERAPFEEKQQMLKEDVAEQRELFRQLAMDEGDSLADSKHFLDELNKLAEKRAKALKLGYMPAVWDLDKKILDTETKLTQARKEHADAIIAKNNAVIAEINLQKQLDELNSKQPDSAFNGAAPSLNTPSEERQFSFAQPFSRATGMEAVDNYLAKIKAGQNAYSAKTDYTQWGKAMKDAQQAALKETVQKVSIVEIKE